MSESPSIEARLAESSWLRALARRLVSDPDLAEDLAQAAAVVALEKRPEGGARRAWLGKVLENLVRQHRRREGQRPVREARAARAEALSAEVARIPVALIGGELNTVRR